MLSIEHKENILDGLRDLPNFVRDPKIIQKLDSWKNQVISNPEKFDPYTLPAYPEEVGGWGTCHSSSDIPDYLNLDGKKFEIPCTIYHGMNPPDGIITPIFKKGINLEGEVVECRMLVTVGKDEGELRPIILRRLDDKVKIRILSDLCVKHTAYNSKKDIQTQIGKEGYEYDAGEWHYENMGIRTRISCSWFHKIYHLKH